MGENRHLKMTSLHYTGSDTMSVIKDIFHFQNISLEHCILVLISGLSSQSTIYIKHHEGDLYCLDFV